MNIQGLQCHQNGIRGHGDPDYKVMLIGIAPGRTEVKTGKPFSGESGRLLDSLLRAVGWSRERVYCTNLICTYNDEPTTQEMEACWPRLQREIELYRPRLIITLSKIATEELLRENYPKKTFGQLQGSVLWIDNINKTNHSCYVLPTYHTAAILHGVTAFVHPIYRDLAKIDAIMNWLSYDYLRIVDDYDIADSTEEAQKFLDNIAIRNPPYVAVDIESAQGKDDNEMLDIFSDKLLCVAISDGLNTIVIPEEHAHDLNWHEDNINWTFHNAAFDTMGISRFLNVRLPIKHDTMLASYNLDERSGVHGLKFLARELLASGYYEEEAHTQAKKLKGFEYIDKDVLYKYNAYDACYTARLAPILYEKMRSDDILWPYHNLLMPAAQVFADIQYRGIKVDLEKFNELQLRWYSSWIESDEAIAKYAEELGAQKPFNPRSHIQLKKLIFDILGLETESNKRTAKGNLSLDKDVLDELHGKHEFITKLEAYRKLDHIVSNYMLVIRDRIKLDGKLHAMTKLHGTVTGRTSMELLQTIPNNKYESNAEYGELREIFIPSDDEHVLVEVDYSKAELYWAWAYSGDKNLLADLNSGDFHTKTAAAIFRKPLDAVTKWDRTRSKHTSFGIMYGRGAKALAANELQCTVMEAEIYLARWKARYPEYMAWNSRTRTEVMKKGELVSMSGRHRRFRLILEQDFKLLNESTNFPIQSSSSDNTLAAMIKLHTILKAYDSYILLMVHDSLLFEINKKHLDTVISIIKDTMEKPQYEGWPSVPVEVAVGDRWGTTKDILV